MKSLRSVAALLTLLSLALVPGCAAESGDAESNIESGNAEYDAVIGAGTPKITVDKTRTATQSAAGHLVGWIPGSTPARVLKRLGKLNQWNEIIGTDGEPLFESGTVTKNTIDANGNGALEGELVAAATLKLGGTSRNVGGRLIVHLENITPAKKLIFVTVVDKGNLKIDGKIVPYTKGGVSGVILDATLKIKLNVAQDEADGMADGLKPIFQWVKQGS